MVKHEAHSVTVSVNSANSLAKNRGQVVKGFAQDVGQDSPFQMAPKSLDQVQTCAVRRQPVDCDPIRMRLEPFLNPTCVLESSVIAYQASFATGVRLDQGDKEVHSTLPVRNCVRRVVHAAIDDLLLVLTRCRNRWLFLDRRPYSQQRQMPMDFDFVFEHESFRGILLQGIF
jgi:hypothetical protein